MTWNCCAPVAIVGIVTSTAVASGQTPPAIRQLGKIERVTTDSLASVAAALPMPGGRVLVNDITARRVLLFDSTLAHPILIADSTGATANAYGKDPGTLIPFRRDTALFIDPSSLSMLVLGPAGKIERVMAIPRPDESQFLIGSIFGTPGIDGRGRLVYFRGDPGDNFFVLKPGGRVALGSDGKPKFQRPPEPDSALVIRVDLETRLLDTVASIKIPKSRFSLNADAQGYVQSTQTIHDPIPVVDDWAMMPDGAIAVVRGRDYHVEWILPDGKVQSSPKMPFDWQRLDDDRKLAIIDSAVKAEQATIDGVAAKQPAASGGPPAGGGGGRGGAGGRGGGGSPGGGRQTLPMVAGRAQPAELSDYLPPFTRGAITPDADGNLWIRTSALIKGQPVYDIVNRRGELTDRVQLPPFRTIAGFAPGVVYLAVKDSAGVVHLERARVH